MGIKALHDLIRQNNYLEELEFRVMLVLANNASDITHLGVIRLEDIFSSLEEEFVDTDELVVTLQHLNEEGHLTKMNIRDYEDGDGKSVSYLINIECKEEFKIEYLNHVIRQLEQKIEALTAAVNDRDIRGYVYMLRCGPYYKIGKAINVERRLDQLSIQLPYKPVIVHRIGSRTPLELERHFHQRFSGKRLNGEWFELDDEDVVSFSSLGRIDLLASQEDQRALGE